MRQVLLLRGINLGSTNRVAMPELRAALEQDGFDNVRTYVQSGNVVLDGDASPDRIRELIAERFALDIAVVTRTRDELAQVIDCNPLADIATEPKRYQVSFLSASPPGGLETKLQELAAESERVEIVGREIYAWHPEGVARSKLWNKLGSKGGLGEGLIATSRNWATVNKLLEMADAG